MMKHFLIILTLALSVSESFPIDSQSLNQFNIIQNKNNEIIYVELASNFEVSQFIKSIKEAEHPQPINTLIIKNFGHGGSAFQSLLKFLTKHGGNLEKLYFLADTKRKNYEALKENQLLDIINVIQYFPVKDFRWQNQHKMKNEKLKAEFIGYSGFWNTLDHLSFQGTKIDKNVFFLHEIKFDSLKSLHLDNTGLNFLTLNLMIENAANFPKLEKLDISKNKIKTSKKKFSAIVWPETTFVNLKRLYFHKPKGSPHIGEFAQKFALPQKMQAVYWADPRVYNRTFLYEKEKEKEMDEHNFSMWAGLYKSYPEVFQTGYFFRDYSTKSTLPQNIKNTMGQHGWFFAKKADIDSCLRNYPTAEFINVTLATPDVTFPDIEYLLSQQKFMKRVQNIYLIHTNISKDELESLRADLLETPIKIHVISNSNLSTPQRPNHWYEFDGSLDNQMWFMQQMQQNTMK